MPGRIQLITMSLACLIVSGCCCGSGFHRSGSGRDMARMFNSPIFGSQNGHPDHYGHGSACGECSACGYTNQCGEPSCGVASGDYQRGCETAWTCKAPAAPQSCPCAACANSCGLRCLCSANVWESVAIRRSPADSCQSADATDPKTADARPR